MTTEPRRANRHSSRRYFSRKRYIGPHLTLSAQRQTSSPTILRRARRRKWRPTKMDVLAHVDAERTVLGCMLSDAESLHRALPWLEADDFSLDSHRRIYHVIGELAEEGKPVDELTVSDALATNRQLESIGGVAYLSSLTYNVDAGLARVTNVEHYAALVLDKFRRRQVRAA